MFRRSRSGRRRTRRDRFVRSSALRSRKPSFEPLEDRRLLAVFTVTNTADTGAGSLRQAIIDANTMANVGGVPDEIHFAIPGAGPHTIAVNAVTGALPDIVEPLTIDGFTQANSSANSASITSPINADYRIIVDGNGGAFDGFRIAAGGGGSTIRGLVINDFGQSGININAANNVIIGNFIGTDAAGTGNQGNGNNGVLLTGGTGNRIGGTSNADRNLISGNDSDGVRMDNDSVSGTTVLGNFIGTDVTGLVDLGNGDDGVEADESTGNTIGGTTVASRNVIAGNDGDGISLVQDADGNTIQGNYIGLGRDGSTALSNSDGIFIASGSSGNTIGGTTNSVRNVIAANGDDGIDIRGGSTDGNMVQGNFIGTGSNGVSDRGNGGDGVEITDGAKNNLIGGAVAGAENLIAFNDDGVTVSDNGTTGNRIQRNSIRNNNGLGIDLGDNGVTPNDGGDPDGGPNLIQNFPQFIGSATLLGDSIALRYLVDSTTGNQAYPLTIEFFVADSDDQEGRTFLAFDNYTGGSAQMEKQITIPAPAVLTNTELVATATDNNGNTSEFSAPVTISPPRFLGSEPTVILPSESIGQDQVDFYQYIAHSTGKLVVRIDFTHLFGDLALEVRDQFGNLLASSDSSTADKNFEEVILPVVAQEKYFISVSAVDFEDDQVNFYALEVENFPAPVPTGVHLDPASDTGMMNNDNVTSDTTPTFFIQTDVLEFVDENGNGIADGNEINVLTAAEAAAGMTEGIAVEVTLVNTTSGTSTTGYADPLIMAIPEVYTFTSPELQPGVYLVSARTKIFDGQEDEAGMPDPAMGRSTASPPLWITISADSPTGGTFDLLSSSDTGMYNNDEVTNKMSPAFAGQGPANAKVNVFAQPFDVNGVPVGGPLLVGNGVVGSDGTDGIPVNGLGLWEVTVEPMADGKYNFFARFETAAGVVGDPVAVGMPFTNITAMAIPNDGTPLNSTIDVTGMPMDTIVDLNVTINIEHPIDSELDIFLIAPDSTEVELSTDNGNGFANYTNTIFDDAAAISITAGVAPFTGTFRPEASLAQLNDMPIDGTWTLRVIDDSPGGGEFPAAGQLLNWSLQFETPLMVVIDTVEPNTPYLDLLDDTGRSDVDNITKDNTPMVSMTSSDPNIAFSQLLFTDNLKFRIYDRYENSANEVLIYDSALDAAADADMSLIGLEAMFTAATQLTRTMPFLTPVSPAITAGGELSDGVHNLKLEVEDRAGNISHDFLLSITVDTTAPPVSFGLPTVGSAIDGLAASSDTGVTTVPDTFADRITSDTTPTLWGRAEADSIVRVYLDRDYDGIIDLDTDTFLGQTVAVPYDGNDAYPDGYWELTSALDLNELYVNAGLDKDGLRRLLVTAEDVAGNPMPMYGIGGNPNEPAIAENVDELQIFIDTQGPQVTDVTINDLTSDEYDLFDPKPSENGTTPLVDSLRISFQDLPARIVDQILTDNFNYEALVEGIAETPGNYLLVGDHVGVIPIQSVTYFPFLNLLISEPLTAVTSTTTITAGGFVGDDPDTVPSAGDYLVVQNGAAAGQVRRIKSYNPDTGQIVLEVPLLNLPAIGDDISFTTIDYGRVDLSFFEPLPDDRYTLTVSDNLVDPANNKLDGESNADEPSDIPTFPSGDGVPGGDFVARFTVDSRPEIGSFVSQAINIDINGNFVWDPANAQIGNDTTNVDLSFTMSAFENGAAIPGDLSPHELLVAGRFTAIGTNSPGTRFFDQLATYGNYNGVFRWLIDLDSDGVVYGNGDPDGVNDLIINQGTAAGFNSTARAGAIPVAGDFDRNSANGDEIGLYYSGTWFLDTNHNYILDRVITGNLAGAPIVGDFDGNGFDDLAVFNSNQFFFDLSFNPLANTTANSDTSIIWGFPGVLDRPVAADMDQDGIDDIGLWVPRDSANPPRIVAEWYFLVSDDRAETNRITGQVNTLNHPFSPVPFGADLYAEFGDELAMPIVGNFDPPVAAAPVQSTPLPGDYDHNNRVDEADYAVWKSSYGSTSDLDADGNGNGRVDSADYSVWRNNKGAVGGAAATAGTEGEGGGSGQVATAAADTGSGGGSASSAEISAEPVVAYAAEPPRIEFSEPAASTSDTVAPSQSDDLSLLLAVSYPSATSVDDALEEFGAGSLSDADSSGDATGLDEVAVAAAWHAWDEL